MKNKNQKKGGRSKCITIVLLLLSTNSNMTIIIKWRNNNKREKTQKVKNFYNTIFISFLINFSSFFAVY